MEETVRSLSRGCAFPVPVEAVTVCQTHISVVFLGGELVYKIKKPVKLPFLDFSTLEQRHFFCHEEVRINQEWAPGVYLGVIPVTRDSEGLRFEGSGPVVDWAVKMRRLPESANLRSRLRHGRLETGDLMRAAQRIAALHRQSPCCVGDQALNAASDFQRRMRENWEFAQTLPSHVIEPQVGQRLEVLSDEWLGRLDDTLRRRASEGHIRELHGDLRLEHVYWFPDRPSPDDIVIVDSIEFDQGLRRIDAVADIAFLVMELCFAGRRDLAQDFADSYFAQMDDEAGRNLLPLFVAYRSAVRAKVAAIMGGEPEIQLRDRDSAFARSRAHWLFCLSELEPPDRRPALVLVSGLPGTGKSTLARGLAEAAHFDEVLRSDVIRKELASRDTDADLYSAECIERTYDECWRRASERLQEGGRVIVDATFQRDEFRCRFLKLALDSGARAVWLECVAPADVVKRRLEARHGDASDADWAVYQSLREHWENSSELSARNHAVVESGGLAVSALESARNVLREHGLIG